jgi:subtilisin family serine protease
VLKFSAASQTGSQDPYEAVFLTATQGAAGNRVVVVKYSGDARTLRVDTHRGRLLFKTTGSTFGHNGGLNTISMAATYWNSAKTGTQPFVGGAANPIETFSSDGPRKIFYYPDGTAISPGNYLFETDGGTTLQKPDFTAADGVFTKTPGFLPFFGTSAAAPHAAAIAALVWSSTPSLTNAQVYNIPRHGRVGRPGGCSMMVQVLSLLMVVPVIGLATGQQRLDALPTVEVLRSAIDGATVGTIELGKKDVKSRIDDNDPQGTWTVDGETLTSNYEVFRFQAEAQKSIEFEVSVYVTVGFVKETMVPLGFVMSPEGTVLPFQSGSLRLEKVVGLTSGTRFKAYWLLVPPSTGTYHLIIAADTRLVGKKVAGYSAGGLVFDMLPLPVNGKAGESYVIKTRLQKR